MKGFSTFEYLYIIIKPQQQDKDKHVLVFLTIKTAFPNECQMANSHK